MGGAPAPKGPPLQHGGGRSRRAEAQEKPQGQCVALDPSLVPRALKASGNRPTNPASRGLIHGLVPPKPEPDRLEDCCRTSTKLACLDGRLPFIPKDSLAPQALRCQPL